MTAHPARPAGYRPFTDPTGLRAELEAVQALLDDLGGTDPDAPILDRVAALGEQRNAAQDSNANAEMMGTIATEGSIAIGDAWEAVPDDVTAVTLADAVRQITAQRDESRYTAAKLAEMWQELGQHIDALDAKADA